MGAGATTGTMIVPIVTQAKQSREAEQSNQSPLASVIICGGVLHGSWNGFRSLSVGETGGTQHDCQNGEFWYGFHKIELSVLRQERITLNMHNSMGCIPTP